MLVRVGMVLVLFFMSGCQCTRSADVTEQKLSEEDSKKFLQKIKARRSKSSQRRVASLKDQMSQLDPSKKNLCAITINSEDEKEVFAHYLPHYNLIELAETDEGSRWFNNACESGLKCDILVISGHFGGAFFGSSGLTLSTEDLERATCEKSCPGILNSPQEVFLFGCNTLAGKTKDHRTPEQYVRVLVEDGFSELEAQNIAAIRYTPIGGSFHDRMINIFANVPKIYGFDSVGPSGRNVRPMLNTYFKEIGNYDQHLSQVKPSQDNDFWSRALKLTTQQQTAGTSGEVFLDACPLVLSKTQEEKLQFILDSMYNEEIFLRRLFTIGDFVRNEYRDDEVHEAKETEILHQIKKTLIPKKVMKDYLSGDVEGFLNVQMNLMTIGKAFGILSSEEIRFYQNKIIDVSRGLSREKAEAVCSYDLTLPELRMESLPVGKWDVFTMAGLACLKSKDYRITEKVFFEGFNHSDEIAVWAATEIIKNGYKSPEIHQRLLSMWPAKVNAYLNSSAEKEWDAFNEVSDLIESLISWEHPDAKNQKIFESDLYQAAMKKSKSYFQSTVMDLLRYELYFRSKHKLYDNNFIRKILEESYPTNPQDYTSSATAMKRSVYEKFFVTHKLCSSLNLVLQYEQRIPKDFNSQSYYYYKINDGYSLTDLSEQSASTSGGTTRNPDNLKISLELSKACT